MNVQSGERVRAYPTRAVYSNFRSASARPRARSRGRSRTPAVRVRPVSAVVRAPVRRVEMKVAPRPKVVKVRPSKADTPILAQSKVEAAKAVMGTYFPNIYRNTVRPGEQITAPCQPMTTTDRYTFTTVADAFIGGYSMLANVIPSMNIHWCRAGTLAAGNGYAATTVQQQAPMYTAASTTVLNYRVAAMEVRIEALSTSSNIQGEWACINDATDLTLGFNFLTVSNAANAARGTLTDARPGFRFIWLSQSEYDDDNQAVADAPTSQLTSIKLAVNTSAAANFTVYITTTWVLTPNAAGQYFFPGRPYNVDPASYARGMEAFGALIQENSKIITDPEVADGKHEGYLSKIAYAIANTVGEARLLVRALAGAAALGRAAWSYGAAISDSMTVQEHLCLGIFGALDADALQLMFGNLEEKKTFVPEEVRKAFLTLSKYRVETHRGRNFKALELVLKDDSSSQITVVLPAQGARLSMAPQPVSARK